MRTSLLACLAAACAAFVLLTAVGANNSTRHAAGLPTLKRYVPAPLPGGRSPESIGAGAEAERQRAGGTLLDEVGRLVRQVSAAEVEGWRRELRQASGPASGGIKIKSKITIKKGNGLSPERRALLHLWLGEYKLADREDPVGAYWHFRTINRLGGKTPELARLKGRAVLNIAIGRFKQGAYEEAHQRFRKLLDPRTGLPGYDRREVALWHRHAAACFGYHERRAQAGITEPEEIDPECGAASLAVVLRSLGMARDRKSVLKACRVTGFGSTLDDIEAAAGKLGLAFHDVILDEAGMKAEAYAMAPMAASSGSSSGSGVRIAE